MSVYQPTREPPRWWERAIDHPEVVVALASIITGVEIILDPWLPEFRPSPSMGELPRAMASYMGGVMFAAGVLVMVGLFNAWDNRSRAWRVESGGWVLIATGWTSYAVVVINAYPGSTIAWSCAVFIALVAVVRLLALKLMERRARAARAARRALDTGMMEEQGRQ